MYKISNDIIHVNKSKYLTPATETRTRGSYGFKYFNEHAINDVFKYPYFLTLYPPNLYIFLRVCYAITYEEISMRWPSSSIYLFLFLFYFILYFFAKF